MQPTALNLVAIAIFTMTFSSLLSPLFHISPFVPAAATFSLMGLATVDTLSWEGKGVTLLLDIFASPQQRQRVIHHEAGHFLTAYFLGIPITGYTLTAWEAFKRGKPGIGGVEFDTRALTEKPLNLGEMRLTLERFCTVWMAGIAAENMVYGNAEGGGEDRSQIRTVLNMGGFPEAAYQQKERWAQLQASNLLEKHQKAYEALVAAMEERASIEKCYQAIQAHC
ncbi:MAG: ATP-dependent Zn protease [Xenococcaceae cyanobacterium MO_188.B32]|nr:ATP-dependent Zn protease [Xenococcaceae cyanobacterium MO_188.B32]